MKKQLKRTTMFLFSFLFLLCLLPKAHAEAKTTKTYGDFEYQITASREGTLAVALLRYNGTDSHLVLPEMIEDLPVISPPERYAHPECIKTIWLSKYISDFPVSWFYDETAIGIPSPKFPELEAFKIDPENKHLRVHNGILYKPIPDSDNYELLYYPAHKKDPTYRAPSNVTRILGTFSKNPYLKTVRLDQQIEFLPTDLTHGSGVQKLYLNLSKDCNTFRAFHRSKKLKEAIFYGPLNRIATGTFYKCPALRKVVLPKQLNFIETEAFSYCPSLKKITIPESIFRCDPGIFTHSPTRVHLPEHYKKYKGKVLLKKGKQTKKGPMRQIRELKPDTPSITVKKGSRTPLKIRTSVSIMKNGVITNPEILQFKSSDKKILRVTKNGTMKALKKGNASIHVRLKMKDVSCTINVHVK